MQSWKFYTLVVVHWKYFGQHNIFVLKFRSTKIRAIYSMYMLTLAHSPVLTGGQVDFKSTHSDWRFEMQENKIETFCKVFLQSQQYFCHSKPIWVKYKKKSRTCNLNVQISFKICVHTEQTWIWSVQVNFAVTRPNEVKSLACTLII